MPQGEGQAVSARPATRWGLRPGSLRRGGPQVWAPSVARASDGRGAPARPCCRPATRASLKRTSCELVVRCEIVLPRRQSADPTRAAALTAETLEGERCCSRSKKPRFDRSGRRGFPTQEPPPRSRWTSATGWRGSPPACSGPWGSSTAVCRYRLERIRTCRRFATGYASLPVPLGGRPAEHDLRSQRHPAAGGPAAVIALGTADARSRPGHPVRKQAGTPAQALSRVPSS